MSLSKETRDQALRRLSQQADALEARTTRASSDYGSRAINQGYRLIGELFAGVIVGMGLGAGFDYLVGTLPWGLIVGTLTGFGVSVWIAMRSARRASERALREMGPAVDLPVEEEKRRDD